ncbi:MAG: hypothetical protein ACJ751_29015 [Niastella sp.]|uniref:hypothetical protein n=1 Tax=Niastella sp. TaxID=1869183 RepID=UPI003899BB3C
MAERFPFVQKWFVFVQAGKKLIEMQVVMDIMWRLWKMGSFFGRRQKEIQKAEGSGEENRG